MCYYIFKEYDCVPLNLFFYFNYKEENPDKSVNENKTTLWLECTFCYTK